MQDVIKKTFGGLSVQYYLRQLFFGSIFTALFIYTLLNSDRSVQISTVVFFIVNAVLYPYSRFVYESVIGFVMGKNVFFVNALLMLITKIITMAICWFLAIFIAPVGLAYLYYHHSRKVA